MTLLFSYRSLSKAYGDDIVFEDLSFNFKEHERLGLIGSNGSGKSTLLKIVAGESSADDGEPYLKNPARLVYLPQEDILDPDRTIEETLMDSIKHEPVDDQERFRRVKRSLGRGGFGNAQALCGTLSGGWKKRVAISRALCLEPDLLLLDEPTNHLDINGILWLEEILKTAVFAFVAVSHDRCFLENVCSRIMEVGKCYPGGYLESKGGYIRFMEQREAFLQAQMKKEESLANKMRRETEWLNQGAKARTTKAKYRIDQAYELGRELERVRLRNRFTATVEIDFHGTERKTRLLLTCHNVGKNMPGISRSFSDNASKTLPHTSRPLPEESEQNGMLFKGITLKLLPGTRLGLMGENGSGKTTFINILENRIEPDEGVVKRAENLKIAIFDQGRSRLDPDMTLKDALSPAGDSVIYRGKSVHVVTWAKKFLFTPEKLTLPVRRLSGGEKARILMAELMREPADILLLDEPTNDLDIPSLEVLEESLMGFPGAVVLVSHDRFLLDRVANSILYLDGRGGAFMFADYHQCLEHRRRFAREDAGSTRGQDREREKSKGPLPGAKGRNRHKSSPLFSYKHKFELEQMEDKIIKAESRVEEVNACIEDEKTASDPETLARLCVDLQQAQEEVDRLYARWAELDDLKSSNTRRPLP
ncbi:MAG: ABC-F family ATP-binding cassette domain-containing protein [Desulfamplus sp.]|nr:ABC-F family ATP-binding cassette domain-containing protein [Desulfamplus sp.]